MDRRLFIIMVMLITIFLGFGIMIPVLPEMITSAGNERFHLYVMLTVYSATSFLFSPLWGMLSDRIGRRSVLLAGVFGFGASFLLLGWSGGNLWLMYASRVLGGVFSGATTSVAVAYVADITPEEERTRAMGLVGMSIGLGFILGPAIGGLLSVYGLATPFFAAAAVSFLNFAFAWGFLTESLTVEQRRARRIAGETRWGAFRGPIRNLFVLLFLMTFALAGLESTLQYFEVERFRATPGDIGLMFLISGIVGALVQGGVIRKFVRQGTEAHWIRAGLVIQAIGFALLLFSTNRWNASLFLSVFVIGNSLIRPCVTSLITQTTTAGQGVTNGLSSSMDSLGRITGPLIAGGLFEWHMAMPFAIGALLSLSGLLLVSRFLARGRDRFGASPAGDPHP